MAIEKMMFVRAVGPIEKLNRFNFLTLSVDYYHPENAVDYVSGAQGYHAVTQPCPFDQPIQRIEDIAKQTDVDITDNISSVFTDGKNESKGNTGKLMKYLSQTDFDSSDINMFLSGLKPAVDSYSKRNAELAEKEKQLTASIDKLKHFMALDVDLNQLRSTNYLDVHFGSLPKDSMIKLYLYDNDNKFIFNTYSSDDKYFWGVYCASKQDAQEAKRIMSALYFDELQLDDSGGSVADVMDERKRELEFVQKEISEIKDFWKKNAQELTNDLSILLDLKKIWNFRKYAVVRDDTFCCVGWIPKKSEKEARELFSSVDDIEFTIKAPERSVTASENSRVSPFQRPIRDIEHLAHHVNFPLVPENLHNCIGRKRPLTKEYIKKVTRYLGGADINSDGNSFSGLHRDIHAHSEKRKKLKTREKELNIKIARLNHFTSLEVDLSELKSVSYTLVRFGRIPAESARFVQQKADELGFIFNIYSSDSVNCWCIYCAPKQYASKTDEIFDSVYFKEYVIDDTSGTVADIIAKSRRELEEVHEGMDEITRYWRDNEEQIIECYSFLQDLQQVWNLSRHIVRKNGKYVYTGSASSSDKKKILALYDAVGPFSQESENPAEVRKEPPVPPTKLKNAGLFKPYEYYVKMYGMPTYGSIDITAFVAITYTVLFGMMFGDLGQGFVLFIGGLFFWKKKKIELARIIIPCGISSMVFGLVFGSFFGYEDLLDPLYKAVGMSGKPLSVMDNINTVLIIAIAIGIALVAAAIIINIYSNFKAKQFGAAFLDSNGLAGLVFYLCGVNLVSGMMNGPSPIPGGICAALMAVCGVILYLKEILIGIIDKHENWKPDSVGSFIFQSFFELFEYVLSYFSNTVSFLRVGAFVLVHAGMMMVVFSLAGDSQNIVVIILGNILIICLEGLLSGIQALRLEFYEMFSRCFEGSGRPFVSAAQILAEQNKQQ